MPAAKKFAAPPRHVHLMSRGARTQRLCGSPTGGFVRLNREGEAWLKRHPGVGICPECEKARGAEENDR